MYSLLDLNRNLLPRKKVKYQKSGTTLVEILLAILILALLFRSAYGVMSYSREAAAKGFWIQKTITQLRNSTQLLAKKLKATSYPSNIKNTPSGQEVTSFKERRTYDDTGRLRDLQINDSTNFDMHAMVTGGSDIIPLSSEQRIMYFPICKPQIDNDPGEITWVELVLAPAPDFKITGAGNLYLRERIDSYNSSAFELSNKFSESLPVTKNKLLVSDVAGVSINVHKVPELRGVYVTKAGKVGRRETMRILVTVDISCRNPKDAKTWLSDQCSVIYNVGIVKIAPSMSIELVQVNSTGPGGSAIIKVNGIKKTCVVGTPVGGGKVSRIISNAVVLKFTGSNVEKFITKK